MTRSCNKCGFFVSVPNSPAKHISYCLFFKLGDIEIKESGEKILITNGEERETAKNCKGYFDVVQHFS